MEIEPIPISALQHWAYCPRQCGLIHLEQAFDDNIHTLRGHATHARVDKPGQELVKGVRVERALPLWEDDIGLIGKADAVEFLAEGVPYPVEYKQGSRHKAADIAECDDIQLAAQALCLEAMTNHVISEGAVFYASSKRRRIVAIDDELRTKVRNTVTQVREMLDLRELPIPLSGKQADQRCTNCSLKDRCQPEVGASSTLREARNKLFEPDA